MGGGALNSCLKLTLAGNDLAYFLKLENPDIIPSTRRGQIAREVAGITMASAAGIPCPAVLDYDLTGERVGRKYMLAEFIDLQLGWELRDSMTEADRFALQEDILNILARMLVIPANAFGDVYTGGVIGQHSTWQAAFHAMAQALMNDILDHDLFSEETARLIEKSLSQAQECVSTGCPPSFYHGDLGLHNVMVSRDGVSPLRINRVIDFGNSLFCPVYANEDGVRQHGGFGLDKIDVAGCYQVSPQAYEADGLVLFFEQAVFMAMLKQKNGWEAPGFFEAFLAACKRQL